MPDFDRIKRELIDTQIADQGYDEIKAFYDLVLSKINRNTFLELGVNRRGSAKIWEYMGFKNGIGVDCGDYKKVELTIPYVFIRGDTLSLAIVEHVKTVIPAGGVDFLFVDSVHSYGYPKFEFEFYSPFVRPGGVVAFHDISGWEVERAFDEACASVADPRPQKINIGYSGIGSLYM